MDSPIMQKWKTSLNSIKETINQEKEVPDTDKEIQMDKSVETLLSLLITYEQDNFRLAEGVIYKAKKVIVKCNRVISKMEMNMYASFIKDESVIVGGLLVAVDVFIVDSQTVLEYLKLGARGVPTDFGLPSLQEASYTTYKELDSRHGILLASSSWLTNLITRPQQWDFVYPE